MTWMRRALCRALPPDWWEFGDDGNRFALDLCSVCPERPLCAAGPQTGVIRAGVAWNARGGQASLCGCGYPLPLDYRGGERGECFRCDPPRTVHLQTDRWPSKRAAEAVRLVAEGLSYVAVGQRLGVSKSMVAKYVTRARPQAVSAVVDGRVP